MFWEVKKIIIEADIMEKREISKFLSGFFTAGALIDLSVILFAVYSPFKALGEILDFKIWTLALAGFLALAVIFAILGWGVRAGKKYGTLLLLAVVIFSFYIGYDVLKIKNINLFQASAVSALSKNTPAPANPSATDSNLLENKNQGFSFRLGADKYDGGKTIATDSENNIYIAGYFQGTVNLDVTGGLMEVTSLGNSLISSATDIYVAKYAPDKKLLWGFSVGSSGKDMPLDLKLDSQNNIYLAGYFGGMADFNPDLDAENNLDAGTGRDAFLAKYDNNGKFAWAKKIGNPEKIPFTDNDLRFEEARSIALDKSNNVYLTGVFDDSVNLDDPNQSTPDNTFSGRAKVRNIFVGKYTSDGTFLKGGILGGAVRDEASAIQISPEGDVYLTGYFLGRSNFDLKNSKNAKASIFSDDDFDIFLAKYDDDFNFAFVKQWGGEGNDMPAINGMQIDKNNNIYIVGNFSGTTAIGKNIMSRGESDVFFVKIDKLGKVIFTKSFGGPKAEQATGIKLDGNGNIYLTGLFKISCNFSVGKTAQTLIAISDGLASDGFLAKYSPEGEYLWARDLGGAVSAETEIQSVDGVAVDKNGNPLVTGYFYKTINFHSTDSLDLASSGATDAFVVEYNADGEIE